MKRMTSCKACQNDVKKQSGSAVHNTIEACRRARRKSPQWWEREPGWARRNVTAELALQSRRLSAQPPFIQVAA